MEVPNFCSSWGCYARCVAGTPFCEAHTPSLPPGVTMDAPAMPIQSVPSFSDLPPPDVPPSGGSGVKPPPWYAAADRAAAAMERIADALEGLINLAKEQDR